MKKGEVWEADVGGKAGKRPVLILTRSGVIPYLSKIVVAEITTQNKGYPAQVFIHQYGNLSKPSFVCAESLHSLPMERLKRYLGEIPSKLLQEVNQAIIFAFDLIE